MNSNFYNKPENPAYDDSDTNRRDINYYKKIGTTSFESWYSNSVNCVAMTSISRGRNNIIFTPFYVSKTITIDRLGIDVTVTGGTSTATARMAIYDSSDLLYPNNLIIDAGTVPVTAVSVQSIVVQVTLQPGLYFTALNHNSSVTLQFRGLPIIGVFPTLGIPAAFTVSQHCYTLAFTYAPYITPVLNNTFTLGTSSPSVFYRIATQN